MNDHYITTSHISKLDHKLLEVRERALKNLLSKIQIGLPFDNVYARQQEILTKCFNLFELDGCSMKNYILELIRITLKSESGVLLINHFGSKEIIKKLLNVRGHVNGSLVNEVDELIKYVEDNNNQQSEKVSVPPLLSDVPLSYRSDCETMSKVESTATSINVFVHKSPENEQQSVFCQSSNLLNNDLFYCVQPLVETDKNILESVEASLKSDDEDELLRTCYFFMDILIRDFSPQVFLQSRTILKELENIFISNDSSEIKLIVAKCFLKFTKALCNHINYCSNPETHSLMFNKQIFESKTDQQTKSACDKNSIIIYCLQNLQWSLGEFLSVNVLESNEIRTEKFHLYVVLLQLINNLVHIIKQFFQCNKKLIHPLNKTINKFAQVICNISLSIICRDYNQQLYIIYITLIVIFLNILKLLLTSNCSLFSVQLKEVLRTIASDVTIMLFYPKIYEEVLEYAQIIKLENLKNYVSLKDVYASFLSAVKVLKTDSNEGNDTNDIRNALKTWSFYKDMRIADAFLEKTVKDDDFNEMICKLLAHKDIGLKLKIYKMLMDKFTKTMGPNMCTKYTTLKDNNNIDFLLNCKIFNEIILSGLSSEDNDVCEIAENILLLVLKSSTIVSENIWRKIIEIILLTFPALACFANDTSPLGQLIIDIIDPDRAQSMGITLDAIFKTNLSLLFSRHASVRNEATSRLCWLLSIQPNHKELLPRLNYISNKLHNVCFTKYQIDVNHIPEYTKTYHQPGVLEKLLKLLQTPNLEPLIKRSTLTQLAVLIEDQTLHKVFLDLNGVENMITLLKDSLIERNYETYPDCSMSLIAILKCLALYNSSVRQNLGSDEIMYYIFRAMLLYHTDDRLIHDGSTLIFCLLYNNFLKGSVIQANLSLPNTILKNLQVPFSCIAFQNVYEDFSEVLSSNIWTKSEKEKRFSLKLMWNFAWFNNEKDIPTFKKGCNDFNLDLYLSKKELIRVQNSSLDFCLKKCFSADQIDYYYEFVKIIGILHLHQILSPKYFINIDFSSLPWKMIFENLFTSECTNENDLKIAMECLTLIIPLNSNYRIYDCLLQNQLMFTQGEKNGLDVEFFRLITIYTKYNSYCNGFEVVNLISDCLSCDIQGFYNLALLDSMLTCLTQITLNPGWSQLNDIRDTKLFNISYNLSELIATFNSGKGENASESVMGSAIIKNAVLSLCHILSEMIHLNIKDWEYYFIEKESGINRNVVNLFLLFESKDVTIRAGVFQLFTGLFLSIDCINELTENLDYDLRELLFSILIDKHESVLVKEYVTDALNNYISTLFKLKNDMLFEIPNVLTRINFFCELTSMLDLCEWNESTIKTTIISIGCLKSMMFLIGNLFQVFYQLHDHFNDMRMLKLFLRLLIKPNIENLSTTRDLEHYKYIMELDIAICNFFIKLYETIGLQARINTPDVIFSIRSLLNKNLYYDETKEFMYFRNKLWSKIFRLLTIIYFLFHKESHEQHQFEMIKNIINQNYLEALCVSLSDIQFKDLLEWALKNLITLIGLPDVMVSNDLISKLFNLFHNMTQNITQNSSNNKIKELVLNALTGLVGVSNTAKMSCLNAGCVSHIMKLLKKIELKLSLEDVESLRKSKGKKKQIVEILTEFSRYLHLLNNLSTDYDDAKALITKLGFISLVYKNWNWISVTPNLLSDTLKTICTLTSQYETACDELALSNFALRKLSSTNTLINAVITVILREMEFISKTHNLAILKYSFQILHNSCCSDDCRTIIMKTNLLGHSSKLHPSMTKHQKSWKQVQLFWLEFLNTFSAYPEGQTMIHKFPELLQILITISESNTDNKILSTKTLRNLSFCSSNKPRLLACVEFLGLLGKLLMSLENKEEWNIALTILWTLSANNQKGKVILKCAGLDGKLKNALDSARILVKSGSMDEEELEEIHYVLQILRNYDN